jgi:hypothetical protein
MRCSPDAHRRTKVRACTRRCLPEPFFSYLPSNGGLNYSVSPDAGTSVWDGKWHSVIGTFDSSTVRLYVDGKQVGSGTPDTSAITYGLSSSNDLMIGNYGGCSGLGFSGRSMR